MKSYPHYVKRGREARITTYQNGTNPDPQSICPVGDPTLVNAFLKGWHSISGVRLEAEARIANTAKTNRSNPRG